MNTRTKTIYAVMIIANCVAAGMNIALLLFDFQWHRLALTVPLLGFAVLSARWLITADGGSQ